MSLFPGFNLFNRFRFLLDPHKSPKKNTSGNGNVPLVSIRSFSQPRTMWTDSTSVVFLWMSGQQIIHPWRLTAGTCPHGGLEDDFPFFSWVICMFHVNLPGCIFFWGCNYNLDPPWRKSRTTSDPPIKSQLINWNSRTTNPSLYSENIQQLIDLEIPLKVGLQGGNSSWNPPFQNVDFLGCPCCCFWSARPRRNWHCPLRTCRLELYIYLGGWW